MQIRSARGLISLVTGSLVAGLFVAGMAEAEIGDLSADSVIGQATFTDSTAAAIGANTFGKPTGIAIDSVRNRVYVSDSLNHRVLGWSNAAALSNGASADLVIGQPDMASYGCNRSLDGSKMPVTLESLCGPTGLAVDSAGNLYVTDSSNCRVLEFDDPYANDTTADHVLGQADGSCNGTIVNASRLFIPQAVTVDGAGNVYVADGSCRVLEFDGPLASADAVADRVYGQADFTSRTCSGLSFPRSLSLDPSGRLYVGSSSLVYEFDNPVGGSVARPQADHTLGSSGCNPGGETSSSTCFPTGIATDSAGRLFVADALNSRVLGFDSPLTVNQAVVVFGQPSFGPPPGGTTFCGNEACNVGGPSASSLCLHHYAGSQLSCGVYYATAVAVDGNDSLWVADGFNNRVLRYDNPRTDDQSADLVLGQPDMTGTAQPVVPLSGPSVAVSEANFETLAIDTNNSRVLVYGNLGKSGGTPIGIFGQSDISATGCNSGGVSARSLCNPAAALVANGYLWIADTGNNRVLRFNPGWLEWDYANQRYTIRRDADSVFGQPDFTSTDCHAGAGGVCAPQGLAVDAHGNLYVSDTGNNRILVDQNPLTADNKAEVVYGQTDFNANGCEPGSGGAASVCDPRGIAVLSHIDPWGIDQGDDLYIADRGNNRVVLYRNVATKPTGGSADTVFGQDGDMGTGTCRQGVEGLCLPAGVALDRGGNLLVADTGNNRVLEYDDPLSDTTADRVFGQLNFTDSACNAGGSSPTAESLCLPSSVAASGAYEGNLFVGDSGNNRILRYEAPYCIESFSLTAANRRTRGIRSKPTRTRLKIDRGPDPSAGDDTLALRDHLILLEDDGAIYANHSPLFTLSTDSAFSTGVVFSESVPPWISNVRATSSGGLWSTGDLEADQGITFYQINTSFLIPPGFSTQPQRDRLTYKAKAVGEDLSAFTAQHAWFRAQFGSTCFTTELKCRSRSTRTRCAPAPAAP
jgi:sugar lactone lactonase YvrE